MAGNHHHQDRLSRLQRSREDTKTALAEQVKKGRGLLSSDVNSEDDLEVLLAEYTKWDKYTSTLLRTLFDTNQEADEFDAVTSIHRGWGQLGDRAFNLAEKIRRKIPVVESLILRCDLLEPALERPADAAAGGLIGNKVFLVHGRNTEIQQTVARMLEKLGLEAIILSEQADQGRALLQKFMDHAEEAAYAVVLLTPDDEGKLARSEEEARPRARQNVIFELGYFLGAMGLGRVCGIHSGKIDLPTDVTGRLYIAYDGPEGGWSLKLVRELQAAGLKVDANDLTN